MHRWAPRLSLHPEPARSDSPDGTEQVKIHAHDQMMAALQNKRAKEDEENEFIRNKIQ